MCTVRSSSRLLGWGCLPGGCLPGGCLPRGVSAWVGVCLGGICPGGVCPGGCLSQHALGQTLPPVDRMTDRCKNIIFPQLRLRTVKMIHYAIVNRETNSDEIIYLLTEKKHTCTYDSRSWVLRDCFAMITIHLKRKQTTVHYVTSCFGLLAIATTLNYSMHTIQWHFSEIYPNVF